MVASTIIREPSFSASIDDTWIAAYRPIYFNVLGDSIVLPNQPMYCDIYLGDTPFTTFYYKTMTSYSINSVGGTNSIFEFDIQDAVQEWLQTYIPNNFSSSAGIVQATQANEQFTRASCFVRFRGSTYSSGILIPETPVPVQPTATTSGSAGGGLQCNAFYALNATIEPNSLVDQYLMQQALIRQLMYLQNPAISDTEVYPLSNLPPNPRTGAPPTFTPIVTNPTLAPNVFLGDSGLFPILIKQFVTSGVLPRTQRNCIVELQYWFGHPSPTNSAAGNVTIVASQLLNSGVYYLPFGLKEIANLAPSLIPILTNANNNAHYSVNLFDDDANLLCFTSPLFHANNIAYEQYRLWFQNSYGLFEQITFVRNTKDIKVSSSEQFTPYAASQVNVFNVTTPSQVTIGGKKRFNLRRDTEISLIATFPEQLIPWVQELMLSPYCLVDVLRNNVAQINNSIFYNFFGYSVLDGSFSMKQSMSEGGRINYEVTIKIIPNQEIVTLRN